MHENKVKIQIIDNPGQEWYFEITKQSLRGLDVVFYIFDLTWKETLDYIIKLDEKVNEVISEQDVIKVIVGNKSDLLRSVTPDDVHEFTQHFDSEFQYFEISAKTGMQIDQMMS